ncbi:hypothetical protein KJ708_08215 [bacterium]|nr:hypothetical protein [bacterium]
MLKLILNILWLIFGGGIAAALSWLLAGCILFITIIGIPYSYACFRIAYFSALPFGNQLIDAREVGEDRIFGTTFANAEFRPIEPTQFHPIEPTGFAPLNPPVSVN